MSKQHIHLVFIGHVDAGKSTLSGNILYLTDSVDKRTIDKYSLEAKKLNRESWFLAFIMDINDEEREKGKTIEVGRAQFTTNNRNFTILDAPGHKNYVPNMIEGASQADIGILVISARKGEFEAGFERNGQTREHALLAKTLGVKKMIVVVNKMDEKTVQWSEKRYIEIKKKLCPYLRKYCGFRPRKGDLEFVPISGLKGTNIMGKIDPSICNWYSGPCLIDILNNININLGNKDLPLRITIVDSYNDRGVIVICKIIQGILQKGDKVFIQPKNINATVLDITSPIHSDSLNICYPGDFIHIKLDNCAIENCKKGSIITSIEKPIPIAQQFIAKINTLELLKHNPVVSAGYSCIMHIHCISKKIIIKKMLNKYQSGKNPNGKLLFANSFSCFSALIEVEEKIALEKYENNSQLGRFTLRDEGNTIAIGEILKLPK